MVHRGVAVVGPGRNQHRTPGSEQDLLSGLFRADADDATAIGDQFDRSGVEMERDVPVESALDERRRQPGAQAALVLLEALPHQTEVPIRQVGHPSLTKHVIVRQAVGGVRRCPGQLLPLAQRAGRKWQNLEEPSFPDRILVLWPVVVGEIRDDRPPHSDSLLEVLQNDRDVNEVIPDHLWVAEAHAQPLDVPDPALERILDASLGLKVIRGRPHLAI